MPADRMRVLLDANRRAGELRRDDNGHVTVQGGGGVLRPAATHTGAYLLQALDEQGWTLAPKDEVSAVEARENANALSLRLEAEVARLRAALQGIADTSPAATPAGKWIHWRRQAVVALEGGEAHGG